MSVTEADREKAADLLRRIAVGVETDTVQIVADALADAREEGRDSVGLGDFLPGGCDAEERAPNYHFAETYGDWLECTLSPSAHEDKHEHEPSGYKWSAS